MAGNAPVLPLSQSPSWNGPAILYPSLGQQQTPENVLDVAEHFYLNTYLSHHDFFDFRYWYFLLEKERRAREAELARKRARRA
jgi:hypothetical protein